ncbi:MAG TPA: c-type cytochrome [Ignavibacteria bacterium]|nr:c-type cytochrome [Ignavibacteria bacterium]
MSIFDQLIIPPTAHHTDLLNIFLVFSMLLFIPYASVLLGASIFSVYFKYAGRKRSDSIYLRFSKDILDKLILKLSVGVGVIVVPIFSITFVYAQLLYNAQVISVSILLLSSLLFTAGIIFLSKFKNSVNLENIFSSIRNIVPDKNKIPDNVKTLESENYSSSNQSGITGLIVLICATFLYTGAVSIAENPPKWDSVTNILGFLISPDTWLNFALFVTGALSLTSASILFLFFRWNGGVKDMSEAYKKFVTRFSVLIAFISTLFIPFFLIIKFLITPEIALSKGVFIYSGLALISLLLVCNFFYAIIRNSEIKWSSAAFLVLIIAFTFIIIKDQVTLANALKKHLLVVNHVADSIENVKFPKNVKATEISGEELYTTKCSACHQFDQKLTGPPYDVTVPKYNGDVKKLAAYIYNPVKIDPGYPAMPNQGVTMKEAEAVAQFLIDKVKQETGK